MSSTILTYKLSDRYVVGLDTSLNKLEIVKCEKIYCITDRSNIERNK